MALARARLLASVAIDGAAMVAWLGLQWVFDWATQQIGVQGDVEWQVAKAILTFGTLGLVVLFVLADLTHAGVVIYREVRKNLSDLAEPPVALPSSMERSRSASAYPTARSLAPAPRARPPRRRGRADSAEPKAGDT